MLQDSVMEKNKIRSVTPLTKGSGTDSKKSQDVSTNKFWPKSGRRREPANNGPTKPPSKPAVRKMDKRARPRGHSGALGGKENTGLTEQDPELGSVFVQGSKKQSLNHLLNFHYTPRGDNWNAGNNVRYQGKSMIATHKHKYNKEHFLQANCQFVVNAEGDYTTYINNPDALVDWDLVEQIHVQVSEFPSCPICLYSPVAAKMTRCGHVYCWSCVLHYLALSEKSWHKCPICYEAVHKNDLKSVVAIPHKAFNIGEHITLRLMRREKGSFTPIPVEEKNVNRNTLLNINEKNIDTMYSKLLLADPSEVLSIIDRERKELEFQLNDDENAPEKCFIEQAITLLNERERIIVSKIKPEIKSVPFDDVPIEIHHFKTDDGNLDNNICDNHAVYQNVTSEAQNEDVSVNSENISNDNTVKNYYFYQAADGQHIYLHALNIRMLEHMYGSLENCPLTLSGRILEKEGGSMTEDLRKRLRYLQHLPITCQFEVAEIQLGPQVISKDTLEFFHDQIETRRKRRQRRARDEKRREKRIAEEENRMMGKFPEVNINFESLRHFPVPGIEDMPQLSSSPISLTAVSDTSERSVTPTEELAGPSFAKMLTTGKAKQQLWPSLSPRQTEPKPRLINVTGSSVPSSASRLRRASDSEPEPEDYVPAPAFNQSFSDAIALALEKSIIKDNGDEAGPSSRGKKKKNKQKILFTTSMCMQKN